MVSRSRYWEQVGPEFSLAPTVAVISQLSVIRQFVRAHGQALAHNPVSLALVLGLASALAAPPGSVRDPPEGPIPIGPAPGLASTAPTSLGLDSPANNRLASVAGG